MDRLRPLLCSGESKAEEFFGSNHQTQCENRNRDFADSTNGEGAKALFAHVTEVRAEANAGERQKKRPARQIGERAYLILVEKRVGGKDGNEQESQDELGEFLPEERSLVAYSFGLALTGPVNRIGEHDEANHRVARGLHEHGQFAGGVGVERASGGGFGSVIDREAGP